MQTHLQLRGNLHEKEEAWESSGGSGQVYGCMLVHSFDD